MPLTRNPFKPVVAGVRATAMALRLRLETKWNVDMLYTCMNTMQENYHSAVGTDRQQPFNFALFDRLLQSAGRADKLRRNGDHAEANRVALAAYDEYVKA